MTYVQLQHFACFKNLLDVMNGPQKYTIFKPVVIYASNTKHEIVGKNSSAQLIYIMTSQCKMTSLCRSQYKMMSLCAVSSRELEKQT